MKPVQDMLMDGKGRRASWYAGTAIAAALLFVGAPTVALSQAPPGGPPWPPSFGSPDSSQQTYPAGQANAGVGAKAGTQTMVQQQENYFAGFQDGQLSLSASLAVEFDIDLSASAQASVSISILGFGCTAYAAASAKFSAGVGANLAAGLTAGTKACEGMVDFSANANASGSAQAEAGYECSGFPDFSIDLAACDTYALASSAFDWFAARNPLDFNKFIEEMVKFIDLDLNRTATKEIITRLDEYDKRLYGPLNRWWNDGVGDLKTPASPYFTRCDSDEDSRCGISCPDTAEPLCDAAQDLTDEDSDLEYDAADICGSPGKPACTSTLPALMAMMRQISMVKIWQTMQIGFMIDAQKMMEKLRSRQALAAARRPRYAVSETSCQVDGLAAGITISARMSNTLYYAMTREDTLRRNNHIDMTPAYAHVAPGEDGNGLVGKAHANAVTFGMEPLGGGFAEQIAKLWKEYQARYCSSLYGDQLPTCPVDAPSSSAGMNRDLPKQIWGQRQTIDMVQGGTYDNYYNMRDGLRTLISPFAPAPLAPDLLKTPEGQTEWVRRRARDARINAIWNVMAKIAADRSSGSGVDPDPIREAAGLPTDPAFTDDDVIPAVDTTNGIAPGGGASVAELRELMSKTRYYDPRYVTRIVNTPEVVEKERLAALAAQSEITQDWYKRVEEMVFMEASMLSYELDKEVSPPPFAGVDFQR